MTLIQILLIILIVLAIFNLIRRFRQRDLTLPLFIFWMFFWLITIFIIIYPESTSLLARILGVGRGVDVVIYFAIIIIFYFIFYFILKIKNIEDKIVKLVREISFLKKDKNA